MLGGNGINTTGSRSLDDVRIDSSMPTPTENAAIAAQ